MDIDWVKHLPPDQKADFKKTLLNNVALRRLREIISDKLSEITRRETTLDAYADASWSAKQAHLNGMRQAYQTVSDLLTFQKD